MRLHVGCAMWTHKAWQARFGPSRDRLSAYAEWCNAVEGNTTFYATPTKETVASWAQQTGPDFRFVIKLPKLITHERRLIDAGADVYTVPRRDRSPWAARVPAVGNPACPGLFGPGGTSRWLGSVFLHGSLPRLPTGYCR